MLCKSLLATVNTQDVTSDVVLSRASSLTSVLQDITQVSDYALANCTLALVETVVRYPLIAGEASTASICVEAFSNVLSKGSRLSKTLLANVTQAMSALNSGMQAGKFDIAATIDIYINFLIWGLIRNGRRSNSDHFDHSECESF